MRFKKGNRWKGSKGQLRYKTWRKMVFELNKRKVGLSKYYVCVKCNKKRKTTRVLHAHHIFSWDRFESKRYDKYNVEYGNHQKKVKRKIEKFFFNIYYCLSIYSLMIRLSFK